MATDDVYHGREQTQLKHRFLTEYLRSWGFKVGSIGRFDSVELFYVDCFAGPWSSGTDDLADTSVAIAKYVAENSPEKPELLLCPKCGKPHQPFCPTFTPKRKK